MKRARILAAAGFTGLTVYLGYAAGRSNFASLAGAWALFFALYAWIISRPRWTAAERRWFTGLGILLRCILLFSLPQLSDDFYRFLWDGRLAASGIHPFVHPPVFFVGKAVGATGITPELFGRLNSPEYHTVYPPVCQAVFWLAAKAFPESIAGGVFVLKLFLLACELGTLWVLGRPPLGHWTLNIGHWTLNIGHWTLNIGHWTLNIGHWTFFKKHSMPGIQPPGAQVLYALNPLILIEIVGNAHFEGAMLCFLLAGLLAMQRQKIAAAAAFFALATASKLLPLLFLPVVWAQLGWRRGGRLALYFTACCLLLFAPLFRSDILANMAGSLNLYFRQFEFNASVYYLLKAAGSAVAPGGTDVARALGPVLGAVVFAGVWWIALHPLRGAKPSGAPGKHGPDTAGRLAFRLVLASALYLFFATTVHPWYVVLPFGLSLLTPLRFPLVWSAAAALSYSHYAGGGFREHYGWIALEYGLVAAAVAWDVWAARRQGDQSLELSPTK